MNKYNPDTKELVLTPSHPSTPTEREILNSAYSPGKFYATCQRCREKVEAMTIGELMKHKCKNG